MKVSLFFPGNGKRRKLKWNLNPVPQSIRKLQWISHQFYQQTPSTSRNLPRPRVFQEDETFKFLKIDTISNFEELNSSHSPMRFVTYKSENYILHYNLVYHEDTGFPEIKKAIKINGDLRVYLQHESRPVPLPTWLIEGKNGRISCHSMLQNLPGYICNKSEEHSNSILDELQQRRYYKPKGRPPYSAEMMWFALLLRYTSSQSYKYLMDHFSLPSFSTINKLKQGELDSLKSSATSHKTRKNFGRYCFNGG